LASHRVERDFPGKTSKEIFDRTAQIIEELAGRYSLKHQPEAGTLSGKVSRSGVEGRYNVVGERLTLELEFSFLIPGVLRKRVQDEVAGRLDRLFA
jgi:Putative polyhydroxyalkanoic acid system protein (PHA_gran_rgn)